MRSFVIHLATSTARRANAEKLCEQLPSATLFPAVDGRDPKQVASVDVLPGTLWRPHYPFALRPAEIGVFQSHRKIWQRIAEDGPDLAIVVEDDLQIDPARFGAALDMVRAQATAESYVRLPVKQREKPARVVARDGGLSLILPRVIGLQCICQVVGRNAALRLLQATERIDRPVDTALQMHWITGQPVHSLLGTGNREVAAQIGGSTIQVKTPLGGKLVREARRAWYRTRLAMHPQRG